MYFTKTIIPLGLMGYDSIAHVIVKYGERAALTPTLAAALPMQAVQDLLVLLGLVAVLLQVGGPVVCVLGQHQLDVPAQGQTLGVEE